MTRARNWAGQARSVRQIRLRLESLETRRLLTVGDLAAVWESPIETPQFGAEAGYKLSADGDFVAISAPGEDLAGQNNAGTVHIYDRQANSLLRSIPNPVPASGDRFGDSVAISGNTLVVGVPLADVTGPDSGRAYVFDVGTGELSYAIDNPTPSGFDFFGAAVAVEGEFVVVTATLDDTANMNSGAGYVFDRQTGALLWELSSPLANIGDNFGASVSVVGNRIAVGVPLSDTGAGSVELFFADTGMHERTIENPTPEDFEFFGQAIDLSGESLVVGAHSENSGAVNSGAAYLFEAATGALSQTLLNPQPALADNFGFAVALDNETVVIGAHRDNTGANDAGSLYRFDAITGSLEQTIANPDPDAFDYFGRDVEVVGDEIVAGAYWDDTQIQDGGAAYFFDATTGGIHETFFSPPDSSYDFFGQSVAPAQGLLAVGVKLDDSGALDSGSVQIYDTQTHTYLSSIENPLPAAGDNFGASVALHNGFLVVGAPRSDAGGIDAGQAYVFDATSGALMHTLQHPQPNALDNFGAALALHGDYIVVGAPGSDINAQDTGAAYVFDTQNGSYLATIANPSAGDFDGFGSALSVDGDLVVIGASFDDSQATDGGAAHVFDLTTAALVSTLVDPFPVAEDLFGQSVTIHDSVVVVGAPRKDVGGIDAGAVHVFDALAGTHVRTISSPIPAVGGFFGSALSSNHNLIAVGSSREDTTSPDTGAAYLFDSVTGNFVERLEHDQPASFDNFGFSISVSDDVVAVGAPLVDGLTVDRGAVYLYAAYSNAAPNASAGGPYLGQEGSSIVLDASASSDAHDENSELLFEWDLDYDGMTFDVDVTGESPAVAFDDDFPLRTIAVRVTDSGGMFSIAQTDLEVTNVAPTITASNASIDVDEGASATNSGTFTDPSLDTLTLSASVGQVIDLGNGAWDWSWDTSDGPSDSQLVEITATDDDGASAVVMFDLHVANIDPELSIDEADLLAFVGTLATNGGSYFDPGADEVSLSASLGDLVDNADGTWTWTADTTLLANAQSVTITATDDDGASVMQSFELRVGNILANQTSIEVDEGSLAQLDGIYLVPGAGTVTLSASVGAVVDHLDGTWSWSLAAADGPADETVTITAQYSTGETEATDFQLVTLNLAPTLTVAAPIVEVPEGSQAANAGMVLDAGDDTVSLTASLGAVVDNGDGTWNWTWDTQNGPQQSTTVTITATDSDGAPTDVNFELVVSNATPIIGASNDALEVFRGALATNSGTFADVGTDVLTLSANIGVVVDNGDGTWDWSWTAVGKRDRTVTITVTDSDGATSQTVFSVSVRGPAADSTSSGGDVSIPGSSPMVSHGANGTNVLDSLWAWFGDDQDSSDEGAWYHEGLRQ